MPGDEVIDQSVRQTAMPGDEVIDQSVRHSGVTAADCPIISRYSGAAAANWHAGTQVQQLLIAL